MNYGWSVLYIVLMILGRCFKNIWGRDAGLTVVYVILLLLFTVCTKMMLPFVSGEHDEKE